jgi:hypothetical protein
VSPLGAVTISLITSSLFHVNISVGKGGSSPVDRSSPVDKGEISSQSESETEISSSFTNAFTNEGILPREINTEENNLPFSNHSPFSRDVPSKNEAIHCGISLILCHSFCAPEGLNSPYIKNVTDKRIQIKITLLRTFLKRIRSNNITTIMITQASKRGILNKTSNKTHNLIYKIVYEFKLTIQEKNVLISIDIFLLKSALLSVNLYLVI